VYIIECNGARYYTGISNHVEQRYRAHAEGRGARFTRAFPPIRLVVTAQFSSKSEAARVEAAIKRLPRAKKCAALAAMAGK
jgi:putative endonuclease